MYGDRKIIHAVRRRPLSDTRSWSQSPPFNHGDFGYSGPQPYPQPYPYPYRYPMNPFAFTQSSGYQMGPPMIQQRASPSSGYRPAKSSRYEWNDEPVANEYGPRNVYPIQLEKSESAIKCSVSWAKLPFFPNIKKPLVHIRVTGPERHTASLSTKDCNYEFPTIAGKTYRVSVSVTDSQDEAWAEGSIRVSAVFSNDEFRRLFENAARFCRHQHAFHPFRILYRCKPESYWRDIFDNRQNFMIPYMKDNNGQAASRINGMINGLFFSARIGADGRLPTTSPFGTMRWCVPAFNLVSPDFYNFYFADFYCNSKMHYVTIVVSLKNSKMDAFCASRLIPLGPENAFFRAVRSPSQGGGFYFEVTYRVWVEFYFTERIHLSLGMFDTVLPIGIGTSRIGGIPHNKYCDICNLYPIVKPIDVHEAEDEVQALLDPLLNQMEQTSGLSKSDCRSIYSLLDTLVDSVSYSVDFGRTGENCDENSFQNTIENVLSSLEQQSDKIPALHSVVTKIRDTHQNFSKRLQRIENCARF